MPFGQATEWQFTWTVTQLKMESQGVPKYFSIFEVGRVQEGICNQTTMDYSLVTENSQHRAGSISSTVELLVLVSIELISGKTTIKFTEFIF